MVSPMQINSLLFVLLDPLMVVMSTTETFWWSAVCNKIRVTKVYSLFYCILSFLVYWLHQIPEVWCFVLNKFTHFMILEEYGLYILHSVKLFVCIYFVKYEKKNQNCKVPLKINAPPPFYMVDELLTFKSDS